MRAVEIQPCAQMGHSPRVGVDKMAHRYVLVAQSDRETDIVLGEEPPLEKLAADRAVERAPVVEENLFLYYKELREKKQVEKERQIIKVSEGVLKDNIVDLAEMNAEAVISKVNDLYILSFYTGFERVVVTVDEKGCYEISLGRDELAA